MQYYYGITEEEYHFYAANDGLATLLNNNKLSIYE